MKHYILLFIISPLFVVGCQLWQEEPPVNPIPVIQIDSPASNARISVGEEIEIKSTAHDEGAVQRVELYVDGQLVQKDLPPITAGQKTFTVLQRWQLNQPKMVELRVIAYDSEGAASHPAAIMLEVMPEPASLAVAESTTVTISNDTQSDTQPDTPESSPSEQAISQPTAESAVMPSDVPSVTEAIPPTAVSVPTNNMPTAAAMPVVEGHLTSSEPLSIHSAPDTQHEIIGSLNPNDVVIGIARNESNSWIKIVYGATNREGWVLMEPFTWQGNLDALAVQ